MYTLISLRPLCIRYIATELLQYNIRLDKELFLVVVVIVVVDWLMLFVDITMRTY